MRFTVDKHERYVVIEPLSGHLDGKAAAKLKEEFMLRNTGGQRNIVLDLRHVQQIDEAGVRMGLLARRICKAVGGLFIITGLNEDIVQYLESINLDTYFIIATDIEHAKDRIFGNELKLDLKGGGK